MAAYAKHVRTVATINDAEPDAVAAYNFHCKILFHALRDKGHPFFYKPDILLIKEYEEWKQYPNHFEHLYTMRVLGCTGLQFRKLFTQSI